MEVYIYLDLLLIVFSIITWKKEKPLGDVAFYVLSFIVFLLPAFRASSVGTDTANYVSFFNHPKSGYDSRTTEFGFQALNWIIRKIYDNGVFYVFVNALLSFTGIFFLIKKESPYKVFSLLLFVIVSQFYFLQFAAMRQSLAISFFLIALHHYLKSKDNFKYAAGFFLLAVFFHVTVLWCLPVVLLLHKVKFTKVWSLVILGASFIIGLTGIFDYHALVGDFFSVADSVGVANRYQIYAKQVFDSSSDHRILWDMLPLTLVCAASLYYADNINAPLLKLFTIGMICNNLTINDPIASRLVEYLVILVIVVLPVTFQNKKLLSIVLYSFTVIYFCYKSYSLLKDQFSPQFQGNKVVPYKSVLF